jgi:dipeptidase
MKWEVNGKKYLWERPIATQQAGFVYVTEARPHLPQELGGIVWYGIDNPYTNFFIPLYTGITELPPSYIRGQMSHYSRDSAWWTVNFVANFANPALQLHDQGNPDQTEGNRRHGLRQPGGDREGGSGVDEKRSPEFAVAFLTRYCVDSAEMNVERWRQLGDFLITKYNDGYIRNEKGRPEEIGYPREWLEETVRKEGKRREVKSEKEKEREL